MIKKLYNWLFKKNNNETEEDVPVPPIESITCGERDEDGFCDTYINGKKADVRLMLWDRGAIEKMQQLSAKIDEENRNERKGE